jgi:hypothetical protein
MRSIRQTLQSAEADRYTVPKRTTAPQPGNPAGSSEAPSAVAPLARHAAKRPGAPRQALPQPGSKSPAQQFFALPELQMALVEQVHAKRDVVALSHVNVTADSVLAKERDAAMNMIAYARKVRTLLQGINDRWERGVRYGEATLDTLAEMLQCSHKVGNDKGLEGLIRGIPGHTVGDHEVLAEFIGRIPEMGAHRRADMDDQLVALRLIDAIVQRPSFHGVNLNPYIVNSLVISLCDVLPRLNSSKHTHSFAAETMKAVRPHANSLARNSLTHAMFFGAPIVPALLYGATKSLGQAATKMASQDKTPNLVLSIVARLLPKPNSGDAVSDEVLEAVTRAMCNSRSQNGVQLAKVYKRLAGSVEPERLRSVDEALANAGMLAIVAAPTRSSPLHP